MSDCLFCKIISKELESKMVYEDSDFVVIMDKFPDSPGHLLIVPKKHITDALEIDDEMFVKFNDIIKNMVNLVKNKLSCDGASITVNYGSVQYVKHYHMHIIPRYNELPKISNEEIYKKLIEK